MKNKKGQLALLFSIPGLIMMLIVIAAAILLVVKVIEYKFIILGSTLLIMSSFYGIKHGFDKTSGKIVLAFGGVGLIVLLLAASGVIQEQFSFSDYIEAPFFGTVKCDRAAGGLIQSASFNLRNDNDGFTMVSPPQNLESYNVLLTHEGESNIFESYRWTSSICTSDGVNCRNIQANIIPSFGINDKVIQSNVARTDSVFFTIERRSSLLASWNKVNEGTYKIQYQPYILFVTNSLEGGSNPLSGSTDCVYPTSLKNKAILSSTVKDSSGKFLSSTIPINRNNLEPNENYNFLAGTVTRASFGNTVQYNGQTGYCAENIQGIGAVIYKIGEIKTSSNTYNVVDTSSPLKTLGTSGCCVENRVQGNRVCKDFKWTEVSIDNIECSESQPCNPGRFILGEGTKTYEFECINTKCEVSNIQSEDCVTNTDCKGDNEICTNFECEKASTIPSPVPGPGTDSCGFGQHSVVKNDVVKSWYNYVGIGNPEIIPYDDCVADSWVVYVIFGSFITIFLLGSMIIFKKESTKKKKSKK